MLNYEDFKNVVEKEVKRRLPIEYKQADVRYERISKVGYDYDGLSFMLKSENGISKRVSPVLNISSAYQEYLNGEAIDTLMDTLAEMYLEASHQTPIVGSVTEDIFEYDKIKDRIGARLINTEYNRAYLETVSHKDIADLSLVYTVVVSEDMNSQATLVIPKELMETWGVDLETVHNKAMENITGKKILFQNLEDVSVSVMTGVSIPDIDIDDIDLNDYSTPMFVMTTYNKRFGAVLAAEPNTMSKITEKLGSVYVLPSSVDEVIIVPKWAGIDPVGLTQMVRDINYSDVAPHDQLSDNIYEFDVGSKELQIVDVDGQDKSKDKDRGFDR